ncbi:MAG: metallophosphoesterase, partial [Polyangiales bacterium]
FQWMQPLLRRGAMLPAIGNHESEQPHELQEMVLRFWGSAGFDGSDTNYDYQSGGVWFFTIDTELDISPGSDQLKWLVARLATVSARPDYRFSVVYQHRPMFTCGDSDDHPDEQAFLEPYFKQYKVPLVLWGHMHGYERFTKNGTTYVTTAGGGGAIGLPSENLARAECGYRVASGAYFHAMVFDVTTAGIRGRAVDKSGAIDDDFTIAAP